MRYRSLSPFLRPQVLFTTNEPQSYVFGGRNHPLHISSQQFIVERIEEEYGVSSYPIATVYLKDIDKTNKRCELCIFTSNDQEWNTESQSIAIKLLLEKAFYEMDMHKVYSYVFYKFIDEAELLKSAGFTSEAILKDEVFDADGSYQDIVRFVIFKKQIISEND